MDLAITSRGSVRCVYCETIDLTTIGRLTIARGSHVEPDDKGLWFADLAPVGGPRLGPFLQRSHALNAETDWLSANWLSRPASA